MKKTSSIAVLLAVALSGRAQDKKIYTPADYERAESMLNYNTAPLIDRADVRPIWIDGSRCWYRVLTAQGSEYVLVDAGKKSRTAYANREELAKGISAATGKTFEASKLRGGRSGRGRVGGESVTSPDGKKTAFIRDYNLWVRDLGSGVETQLTTDGIKD